jgi:23S rRNA (adenine2503-C2)-methyltransferase
MLSQLYETENIDKKIQRVVIMGVGEPLDNFDNVIKFLQILHSPNGHGMSLRHVSLSTCGLADKIDELAQLKLGLTLSVSLHASNDEDRNRLMPVNNKYNLNALLNSCSDYFKDTSRRISFEYSLIDGVNDSVQNAYELSRLLKKFMPNGSFHVNLIPVNSIAKERLCRDRAGTALQGRCTEVKEETAYKKSENIKAFSEILEKERINVTTRRSLGGDINAACGQLRLRRTIDN